MASNTGDSIYELQRRMMRDDVSWEKKRTEQALKGKTGVSSRRVLPPGRKEGFDSHYLPPYPNGISPNAVIPRGAPAGNYRPGRKLDTHEILKNQMFASSSSSCNTHFEKNRACPSSIYGVSDQYVILDTFEKVRTSRPDKGEFQFNFMVQGVTRDQTIGVKDRLNTIIGIQVCDFCVPKLSFDDFDDSTIKLLNPSLSILGLEPNGPLPAGGNSLTNPQSQTPFCSRITMFLKEIGLQSYSDTNNRRHHFEFSAKPAGLKNEDYPNGDRLHLRPLHNCDIYLFTDPIQDIHGLTICFYNPDNVLRFPPDCLYDVVAQTDINQQIEFTYTDPSNLINLKIGDRIFIQGFEAFHTTGGVRIPYGTLNSWITRPEGQIVGAGGFQSTGPTKSGTTVTFRLNPDVATDGLSPPIPASTVINSLKSITVCIAKNRIRIPMRFRRIVGRLTNYIAP
jgi:hypothetical protein